MSSYPSPTAGTMKTAPSVFTLNTIYLAIPEYTGSRGNRFQETHGTITMISLIF